MSKLEDFLILNIACDVTQNRTMEEDLRNSKIALQEQKIDLEMKDIALNELLNRLEIEKKRMHDNEIANIDKLFKPAFNNLK